MKETYETPVLETPQVPVVETSDEVCRKCGEALWDTTCAACDSEICYDCESIEQPGVCVDCEGP